MSIDREWIKTIQNTSKLLHALGRGWDIPSFSIRNKSMATSIRVHQTSAVLVSSYNRMIADTEWKRSQAYMIQNRTSVR